MGDQTTVEEWKLNKAIKASAQAQSPALGVAHAAHVQQHRSGGLECRPPGAGRLSGRGEPGATSQLLQAMAGFGSGGADTSNTVPLAADTSQQQFLTMPQHA